MSSQGKRIKESIGKSNLYIHEDSEKLLKFKEI